MQAVILSDPEIVEALLSVGADPNAVSSNGSSALSILAAPTAASMPNSRLTPQQLKLLQEYQAKDPRRKPDQRKDRIRELLLQAGAKER